MLHRKMSRNAPAGGVQRAERAAQASVGGSIRVSFFVAEPPAGSVAKRWRVAAGPERKSGAFGTFFP